MHKTLYLLFNVRGKLKINRQKTTNQRQTMKNTRQSCSYLTKAALTLAIVSLAWLPSRALAQEKLATKLMPLHTYEDLQKVDAGDTIVMTCPKCKDTYTQVVEKSFKTGTPDELKNVTIHLCSSCETKIVTKGTGKQAKNVLVHTCKTCGSENVTCCVMKKGGGPTPGMETK
jgi:hypothetical protein